MFELKIFEKNLISHNFRSGLFKKKNVSEKNTTSQFQRGFLGSRMGLLGLHYPPSWVNPLGSPNAQALSAAEIRPTRVAIARNWHHTSRRVQKGGGAGLGAFP